MFTSLLFRKDFDEKERDLNRNLSHWSQPIYSWKGNESKSSFSIRKAKKYFKNWTKILQNSTIRNASPTPLCAGRAWLGSFSTSNCTGNHLGSAGGSCKRKLVGSSSRSTSYSFGVKKKGEWITEVANSISFLQSNQIQICLLLSIAALFFFF